MKKLGEKRQLLIGSVLLVVMVFFYFNFLLLPLLGKFKQRWESAGRYRRDLIVTRAGLTRAEQIKKEIERLEGIVGMAKRRFPSEQELPILLEEISTLAENAGVKILEIKPEGAEAAAPAGGGGVKGLKELPISLSALSGYHDFGVFVNALEHSDRIYLVKDLSIRSSPANERLHSFRLVLKALLQEKIPSP